jgi:hypothetical protein
MRNQCHQVLDFAYRKVFVILIVARVYGESEEFLSLGLENKVNLLVLLVPNGAMNI